MKEKFFTFLICVALVGLWIYSTYYYFCEFIPFCLNIGSVIISFILYLFVSSFLLAPFIIGIVGKIKNVKGNK